MLSPKSEISTEEYSDLPPEVFQYIGRHCKYPTSAIQKGIQGEVVLQMSLDGKGELKALEVVKSIDPLLDTEALRVVKNIPKWKTGKEGITQYIIPITFNLQ
jgi:protein TonB